MKSPAFCRQKKAGSVPGVRQGQRVLRAVCVCVLTAQQVLHGP